MSVLRQSPGIQVSSILFVSEPFSLLTRNGCPFAPHLQAAVGTESKHPNLTLVDHSVGASQRIGSPVTCSSIAMIPTKRSLSTASHRRFIHQRMCHWIVCLKTGKKITIPFQPAYFSTLATTLGTQPILIYRRHRCLWDRDATL